MVKRLFSFFLSFVFLFLLANPVYATWTVESISDNQLFFEYPYYLADKKANETMENSFKLCQKIIDSQNGTQSARAVFAALINDSWQITFRQAASALGLTKSYQDSLLEKSAECFISEFSGNISPDSVLGVKIANAIVTPISTLHDLYGNVPNTTELIEAVLEKLGISNAASQADAIDSVLTSTATSAGLDAYNVIIGSLELFTYRYELVKLIQDEMPEGSDLRSATEIIMENMNNPTSYIKKHFVSNVAIKQIASWADENAMRFMLGIVGTSKEMANVFLLMKNAYYQFAYDGFTVEQYAVASNLLSYAAEIDSKLSQLYVKFIRGNVTSSDVELYKALLEVKIFALCAALKASANLLSISNHYDWQGDAMVYETDLKSIRGYDWFFYCCKKALSEALNNDSAISNNSNHSAPQDSSISISGISTPSGVLIFGQPYDLRGVISSGTSLTNVTADIYNSSGNVIAHYSVNPNKTVYNIYSDGLNFDSQFRFGTFPTGSYRYVVSATNAAGTKELINSSFSIGSAPQGISVSRYEDCYVSLKCPTTRVVNLYKNPTDTSRFSYFSKGQEPRSHRKAYMSDGSTWYEVGVNHNGADITLWLKYESDIIITDLSSPPPAPQPTPMPEPTPAPQPSEEDNSSGWSAWSDTPASSSSTLEVQTRQVVDVEGHTEYRYGRWLGETINWCKEYAESLHRGSVYSVDYTSWRSSRAVDTGTHWLCGCFDSQHSSHIGSSGYDDRGYPMWTGYSVYSSGDPDFYWEETRWVDTTFKTQYRTRAIKVPSTLYVALSLYDGRTMDYSLYCTEGQPYGELPVPVREGYTFDGWYTLEDGGELITSSSIFTEFSDQILYAHWTPLPPKIFTVSFDANGGFVDPTSITVTENETYGSLPTPVRTDYTFDGWFTSSSGGSLITSATSVNLSGSQTLYAHWTKIPVRTYTVSFNPQGGSVSSSSKTVTNGETYGSLPIPVRDGYAFDGWFTSGASQVTSSTIVNLSGNQELQAHWTKVEPVIQKAEPVVQFVDVPATSFCFDAVQWAVENGVTKGTTATTFSPQTTCSTAHIITFLWRAKGCPEPSISNPFSDLNPESYFAKAAIWAFEKGLVSGNIFNGGKPCTRARTVVFLWILSGKPIEGNSSFSDVPQTADYAYAVAWAVNQNITNGTTETTFSPDRICTRGHIVTFLQRYFA